MLFYSKNNLMEDLKRFIINNKKILSVFFTVVFSAFVVATIVYGATTIGANITTGGNVFATGTLQVTDATTFYATSTWSGVGSDIVVEGLSTSTFAGNLDIAGDFAALRIVEPLLASSTLVVDGLATFYGSADFGDAYTDTLTITSVIDGALWASSTLQVTDATTFFATTTLSGVGSDLIVEGVSTSTFAGDLFIGQSGATTTLHIGGGETSVSAPGQGACIALRSSASTTTGVDTLYLILALNGDRTSLEFTTSTVASDCY